MRRNGPLLAVAITAAALSTGCSNEPAHWTETDRAFVARMIPHHHLGMTLVDEATVNSDDVRLRRLVFEMSGYHQSELDRLMEWADSHGIDAAGDFPGHLPDDDIAALASLDGAEHDIWWLDLMLRHHRGAVQMADAELASGQIDEVRDLADTVRRVQSDEIEQMDGLRRALCAEQPAGTRTAGC